MGNYAIAFKGEQLIHHPVKKIAVMRNHHHGAGEIIEVILEHCQRLHVEVVGRFVKQQYIRRSHQNPQQEQATPLAAG